MWLILHYLKDSKHLYIYIYIYIYIPNGDRRISTINPKELRSENCATLEEFTPFTDVLIHICSGKLKYFTSPFPTGNGTHRLKAARVHFSASYV